MSLRGKIAAGAMVLSSSTLVVFLGTWEGNGQNTVYADKLARGLPTVCKGITRHTSPYPVVVGDYWSDARCDEVEQMVIRKGQLQLADCITNQDVGQDGVWDVWQIEGPSMIWYFRGDPHVHCWAHIKERA